MPMRRSPLGVKGFELRITHHLKGKPTRFSNALTLEFDPQAIVKIADDTIEYEDVLILVYTAKPSLETIQHIVPYTGDILVKEDLDILVVPEDKDRVRIGWSKSAKHE
jgi:hypothetical protein